MCARGLAPQLLVVPMLREGTPIGAITVRRSRPSPSPTSRSPSSETFADQAVIAIENVRLFTELQEKNRALMEAHARSPSRSSSRPPRRRSCG